MIDTSVIVAILAAIAATVGAFFTYRSSIRATTVDARKVDQEAYDQSVKFYQRQLDDANRQIDRITLQMDRLNVQLEKEQDVSNTLRKHVGILQNQVETLNDTIKDLREQLKKPQAFPA